jgi:hypothetical protein
MPRDSSFRKKPVQTPEEWAEEAALQESIAYMDAFKNRMLRQKEAASHHQVAKTA